MTFLNLRGSVRPEARLLRKVSRILVYYVRLIRYAAVARPKVFHILWNNKFESFDRTLLMLYYKLLRKRIALTVHNVNKLKRDNEDTILNRLTLRIQYRLADRLFVHTGKMRAELINQFGVHDGRIVVIPFGINNSVPNTDLRQGAARERLGLSRDQRVILFFGRITPYKGLDCLISAFQEIRKREKKYRLVIAGRPDRCEAYWRTAREQISNDLEDGSVLLKDGFIPDQEVEVYFKAADVLVLPYRDIYQSGVLFTGQGFGIPILASDVGSFGEDIVEGETGFLFRGGDWSDLAGAIERYFASDLYNQLESRRRAIYTVATEQHSWKAVAEATICVYNSLFAS